MCQYNMLQAFFMSFYSKKLYRDVAANWHGKAFLYLFLLLALSWIGTTVQFQKMLNHGYDTYADKLAHQFPVLTINQGVLSTPENRPYLITNPDTNETVAVIDTSGQYTTLDQAGTALLVTPTEYMVKTDSSGVKTQKLPADLSIVVSPDAINSFLSTAHRFTWVLLLPLLLIGSYLYRVNQVLLYGILGKFLALICGAKLSYFQLLSIIMVALTPSLVCATAFDYFSIRFDHQLWLYFGLTMLYLLYAIIANIVPTPAQEKSNGSA